ncbi:MAG: hypothetical protein Tsb0020_13260 [Haliangiales bacterium]
MPSTPHDAHDSLVKAMFSRVDYAADELRIALPAALVARLDLAALRLCPGSFVSPDLRKQHTDLLYSAPLDGHQAFLYLLLEHQSTVDRIMPYRMLRYMIRIWDRYLSDHSDATRVPVIIPLVMHHSDTGWSGPTSLGGLVRPRS